MTKIIKLKETDELTQELSQSIMRFEMMMKDLKAIPEEQRTSSQQTTIEVLEECQEIVDDIKQQKPVWNELAIAFIDDIKTNWEWYQQDQKEMKVMSRV